MLDKQLPKCYNKDTKREASSQKEDNMMAGHSIWCTNYDWDADIRAEQRAQKKRWDGKVITTGRQWANNADGALAVSTYSEAKLWDAVRDYYDSREW